MSPLLAAMVLAASTCRLLGPEIANAHKAVPHLTVLTFHGEDAAAAIDLYNHLPPPGHLKGDVFMLLIPPTHSQMPAAAVVADHGCVQSGSPVPLDVVKAFLFAIEHERWQQI